ncbi:MAG: 50S ribosomal protein L24 [Pirellulales bacterium]|nr:50S ribosomal protein L24 [Pirellulales bacterium]
MRIRKDDIVEVISGADKSKRAKVLTVLPEAGKVIVEGVNRVYKHVRRSQRNPQGGRLAKEMPIDASNVLLVCPACGQPTRLGARFLDDGSKDRFCKKCGASAGRLSPPKAARAKKK